MLYCSSGYAIPVPGIYAPGMGYEYIYTYSSNQNMGAQRKDGYTLFNPSLGRRALAWYIPGIIPGTSGSLGTYEYAFATDRQKINRDTLRAK